MAAMVRATGRVRSPLGGAGPPTCPTAKPGLAEDAASTAAAEMVVTVAGVVGSVVTARALGPAGRGVLSLVTLWVLVLAIGAPLSCGYGLIYDLRRSRVTFQQAVSTALGLSLTLGVAATAASLWGGQLLRGSVLRGVPFSYLLVASLSLPAAVFLGISGLALIGAGRVKQRAAIAAFSSLLGLALLYLFLFGLRLGVWGAVAASAMTSVLGAGLTLTWLWRDVDWRGLLRPGPALSAIGFGLKTHGGVVAQLANFSLDRFLINCYLGPAAVGIYSVSALLAERLWVLPGAVGTALYPRTGGEAGDDGQLTARACRKTLWLMACACLLVAAASRPLVAVLFGREFAGAVKPLLLLLPGVLCLSAGKMLAPYIQNRGRPLVMTYIPVGALALTLGLNLLLIPRWGISGAAVASTVAYAAYGFGFLVVFHRLSGRAWTDPVRFPAEDLSFALRAGRGPALRAEGQEAVDAASPVGRVRQRRTSPSEAGGR